MTNTLLIQLNIQWLFIVPKLTDIKDLFSLTNCDYYFETTLHPQSIDLWAYQRLAFSKVNAPPLHLPPSFKVYWPFSLQKFYCKTETFTVYMFLFLLYLNLSICFVWNYSYKEGNRIDQSYKIYNFSHPSLQPKLLITVG